MGFSLQCVSVRLFSSSVSTFMSICLISPCVSLLVRLFFYCLAFLFLAVFSVYFSSSLSLSISCSVHISKISALSFIFRLCPSVCMYLRHSLCVSFSLCLRILFFCPCSSLSISFCLCPLYISLSIGNFLSQLNTLLLHSRSVSYCLSPSLSFFNLLI